jgi:DNA adenine methylase
MPPAVPVRIQQSPARAPQRTRHAPAKRAVPAAPIVKWAGGKTRLLDEILARRPARFGRYFEPFLGGGAVFFKLSPTGAVLSDINADLINAYRCVANQLDAVLRRLRVHRDNHGEGHYYATRERWNRRTAADTDVDRAAMFIYLNKTCYNGLWRVNRSGEFNVPMGRYRDPSVFDAAALHAASQLLRRAELRHAGYREVAELAGPDDFVYFDPPYQPRSVTSSFTSYTSDCFGEDDQRELAATARALAARGCAVMVSNSDTPLIRELYAEFNIERVACSRAINSRADSRGAVSEVLITA